MRGWATMALMMAALAPAAAAEMTDVEQLKLRPETFVGKTISVEGILFGATRIRAALQYKAGRLNDDMLTIEWADHGPAWERAQYDCANDIDEKCRVIVIGVLRSRRYQADTFYIEKATVDFGLK